MEKPIIRIGAVADVHAPKYLDDFTKSLAKIGDLDVLLLVGDVVLKGDFTQMPRVIEEIKKVYSGKIFACFGNEEYEEKEEALRSFEEITWLDDQAAKLEIHGKIVGIVGSRGSLDRPTSWQRKNRPELFEVYRKRVEIVDNLLENLKADLKIVISHYAPTYLTLEGEEKYAWPEMGCKRMEDVIKRRRPDVWFHGHAHRSARLEAEIGRTFIMNVSLPARKEIAIVELPRKFGLERFF